MSPSVVEAESEAAWELVTLESATVIGAAAVLAYIANFVHYDDRPLGGLYEVGDGRSAEPHHFLHRTLARALAKLAALQFNAAEFIDTLAECDCRMQVLRYNNMKVSVCYDVPFDASKEVHGRHNAAIETFQSYPTATEEVVAECVRRGLVIDVPAEEMPCAA